MSTNNPGVLDLVINSIKFNSIVYYFKVSKIQSRNKMGYFQMSTIPMKLYQLFKILVDNDAIHNSFSFLGFKNNNNFLKA